MPEWEQDTQVVHPKRLEHHQSGHLTKDPGCPVCMEEAGSKINHRRKKGDRSPGVMHCDQAAFEASADGHKYCLIAAVMIEINKESKLLPIFVPMPKKDTVCAVTALSRKHLPCVITAICIRFQGLALRESKQTEEVSLPIRRFEIYVGRRTLHCLTLQLISHPPMALQSARLVCSRPTVRRMLKQAHLGREWWSYACRFAGHMMREKVLGREWPHSIVW